MMRNLTVGSSTYEIVDLAALAAPNGGLERLPLALRILVENVARHIGRNGVTTETLEALLAWQADSETAIEVPFHPARVLMQDFTGMPALVDLAALREAVVEAGGDGHAVNPAIPIDIVIDHSLIVDETGHAGALNLNIAAEFRRNGERYRLAKWAEQAFDNLRVVPPGKGIVHQINLEYLATVVRIADGQLFADTLVGADSHSTMVNGLGVLGWGVGGIEAEAAMLGLPLVLPLKRITGVRLSGNLGAGVTATDLVLTITQALRRHGVVDSLVEFLGPALSGLGVADRATIANMAPDYGSTCALFPIDTATIDYLRLTGRDEETIALVEAYARAQGLWYEPDAPVPAYSDVVEIDLAAVEPCGAGPRRPQDRVPLALIPGNFAKEMKVKVPTRAQRAPEHGAVVIAAITSCTNTSNPALMIAAGLLARKAMARGLRVKPWVKTSFTPGSQVVGAYLAASGLQDSLDGLGFHVAGYGCATCGGFSGRLSERVETDLRNRDLVAVAVLSGNRNFEGRIHPQAQANYLVSPPLVVAYALAGSIGVDLTSEPLGRDPSGLPVFLRELWPSPAEIARMLRGMVSPELFRKHYGALFVGTPEWESLSAPQGQFFRWDAASTYVKRPPFFDEDVRLGAGEDIRNGRILLLLDNDTTTDHISPVGAIPASSEAGKFLAAAGIAERDFNAYGARRTNHAVMVRGTFANPRLRNALVPGVAGGMTLHHGSGELTTIFDAATRYAAERTPLIVIAGSAYGTGSARDWAAKGTRLMGVRAVIAVSFERIHRANLAALGVLPLQFCEGESAARFGLDGSEILTIEGLSKRVGPGKLIEVSYRTADGRAGSFQTFCRLDSAQEVTYWRAGGVLSYALDHLRTSKPEVRRQRRLG